MGEGGGGEEVLLCKKFHSALLLPNSQALVNFLLCTNSPLLPLYSARRYCFLKFNDLCMKQDAMNAMKQKLFDGTKNECQIFV